MYYLGKLSFKQSKGTLVESFILLGQLPGTSFQITFLSWLAMAGLLLLILAYVQRRRLMPRLLRGLVLASLVLATHRRFKQQGLSDQIAL